jgi:hypothetical protein
VRCCASCFLCVKCTHRARRRFWGDNQVVLERTLDLFCELTWTCVVARLCVVLGVRRVSRRELAHSYSSANLLLTLDAVSYMLSHHTVSSVRAALHLGDFCDAYCVGGRAVWGGPQEEHFAFLSVPSNTRLRTTFYSSLARLVFINDTDEVW